MMMGQRSVAGVAIVLMLVCAGAGLGHDGMPTEPKGTFIPGQTAGFAGVESGGALNRGFIGKNCLDSVGAGVILGAWVSWDVMRALCARDCRESDRKTGAKR